MIQNGNAWFCDESGCDQKLGVWSNNSERLKIDLHRLLIYIKPIGDGNTFVKVMCPVCRVENETSIPKSFEGLSPGSDPQGIPWHCINPMCEACFGYWQPFTSEMCFDLLKPGSDYRVYLYVSVLEESKALIKQVCRRCREENEVILPDTFLSSDGG